MIIDTSTMVPMTEANQNFSKVARLVDEKGSAIIMKNNKPRYALLNFDEYAKRQEMERDEFFENTVSTLISENMEAFLELAK
ncbi:MAG: type II toxin-antitoxin system Phd/YefM family antitoxin [Defluviitaleaceae bacterium]|nr:type II toxin-antitoxin system Phd/YefM family antitoxin [Defluviitaleaceae bacterium]